MPRHSVKDWPNESGSIDKIKWFAQFEGESKECEEVSKTEGEIKRRRGRPRKNENNTIKGRQVQDDMEKKIPIVNGNSFSDISHVSNIAQVLLALREKEYESFDNETVSDEIFYVLLAKINEDPISYKEALESPERLEWQKAIDEELCAMKTNNVWKIVNRPNKMKNDKLSNIIDSKWVFKSKIGEDLDWREPCLFIWKEKGKLVIY